MNNIETMEFSTANLERLAFYFKNLKMEVSGKWYTTTKFYMMLMLCLITML